MRRVVLGFNAYIHDTAAALVADGRVLAFAEEERFRREKHTTAFPDRAIAWCLHSQDLTVRDLDGVAFYWQPLHGLARRFGQTMRHLPESLVNVRRLQGGNLRRMLTASRAFRRRFGYTGPFHHISHYLAHASHAAFTAPFDESLVLVVDGNGEIATTLVARRAGLHLEPVHWTMYPHSLGLLWCTATEWLGYHQNCDEGKVMGLAPYGDDALVPAMARIVRYAPPGRLELDMDYFDFHRARRRWFAEPWEQVFGPPRMPDEPLNDRHRAVAFALQHATEQVLLSLVDDMTGRWKIRNVAYTGGVALNCVANGKLAAAGLDNFYVPPAAYDAGTAVGAAIYADRFIYGGQKTETMPTVFSGPTFDDDACRQALASAGVVYRRETQIEKRAAEALAAGRIVGWFQGAMENGPRALGHRSILADPRRAAMKDHLNARVKHREAYRPFGASVLADHADELFELGGRPSPYMLLAVPVAPAWRERLGAVTHVDGSCRVQTVTVTAQPRFARLLTTFAERTGVPALLNTSFNVMGEPIVQTPREALACYLSTGIDALALGEYWVEKEPL